MIPWPVPLLFSFENNIFDQDDADKLTKAVPSFLMYFVLIFGMFFTVKKLIIPLLTSLVKQTNTLIDDFLVWVIDNFLSVAMLGLLSLYFTTLAVPTISVVDKYGKYTLYAFTTVKLALAVQDLVRFMSSKLDLQKLMDPSASNEATKNKKLEKNMETIVAYALWITALLFVLDNAGFNITSLLAGLGIGGIAMAMATQTILIDALNALVMLIDRPFSVGDLIAANGVTGFVEYIGFKSTKIRSVQGPVVVMTNSTLASGKIENQSVTTEMVDVIKIGISPATPPEVVAKLDELIKAAVAGIEKSSIKDVIFCRWTTTSYEFEVKFGVLGSELADQRRAMHLINVAICKMLSDNGIKHPYSVSLLKAIEKSSELYDQL
eukprot:TRINITY_DN1835_c0_g1_i1.p1 TRINITY_DN1835_c0_g1~~TRINITY_DN1835_c0_g1_i1.p1  ORF type:complete len:378 (+),score=57.25 TRINITY_DN1835_c0_g1_i1:66-1199(+)